MLEFQRQTSSKKNRSGKEGPDPPTLSLDPPLNLKKTYGKLTGNTGGSRKRMYRERVDE